MKFRFTNYGFINALISLIPIFPLWSLFPTIGIEAGIQKITADCIFSYKILLGLSIIVIIGSIAFYLQRIKKILIKEPKTVKRNFRLFSLLIYTFANTVAMIIILGPYLSCNGSSMSIMVVIYSGPIASGIILILGFLIDLRIKVFPPALIIE